MAALTQTPQTMTSLEIAELVQSRHDKVRQSIERLAERGVITLPPLGEVSNPGPGPKSIQVYRVGKRDSYVIVAQLSPEFTARLVDRWQELEAAAAPRRVLTSAEQFLALAQITVDLERAQNEIAGALVEMHHRVGKIEAAGAVQNSCPAAAEPITRIRLRMNREFGLSASTVDAVMRQSSYAPKPACLVRNDHVEAEGATYAAFWKKDVSQAFKRFVSECVRVTPTQCTHPFVEGRFKLLGQAEAA